LKNFARTVFSFQSGFFLLGNPNPLGVLWGVWGGVSLKNGLPNVRFSFSFEFFFPGFHPFIFIPFGILNLFGFFFHLKDSVLFFFFFFFFLCVSFFPFPGFGDGLPLDGPVLLFRPKLCFSLPVLSLSNQHCVVSKSFFFFLLLVSF